MTKISTVWDGHRMHMTEEKINSKAIEIIQITERKD